MKYRIQMRVNTARKTMASMPESIPRIFPVPSPVRTITWGFRYIQHSSRGHAAAGVASLV